MISLSHVTEIAVTNLQTFLLYLFLPNIRWIWMAVIWGAVFFIALFGAFIIRAKWGRKLGLCANVLINAMTHPVAFLTLYASGLFYYFAWYRDMYIILRNQKMSILFYVLYILALVIVYLIFLGIEYFVAKKMGLAKKWDNFLSFILPAHRGYVFGAIIVFFGTGRVVENVLHHYMLYRAIGIVYFIVIIYLNTRALTKHRAILKTVGFVLFELFVLVLLMLGAIFQAGRPGYLEEYLKEKGISLEK